MARRDDKLAHYGPEPHLGMGPEMVHAMIHERAIGKTVAAVYLGDSERFRAIVPEDYPPDGVFRGEYVAFEFTDGSALVLEVASGNSFSVDIKPERILKLAKAAAIDRGKR